MNLYPQSMGMDGGEAGKLMMEDMGGLLLLAKEGIRLESMTGISVQGVSDIMALYGAGTSSLCVNGSVDMMGALTGLGGSTYRNYAPYADAPEEGKFDWGGFTRNLVMGLAVGAACIAMSLLLPGIGTIAAGALMGAGIGAVSASVAGAVGDYSSGNVRSAEEAIRDVAVSMVSGALTGAITGGLGAKLTSAFPKAAEAVEKSPWQTGRRQDCSIRETEYWGAWCMQWLTGICQWRKNLHMPLALSIWQWISWAGQQCMACQRFFQRSGRSCRGIRYQMRPAMGSQVKITKVWQII